METYSNFKKESTKERRYIIYIININIKYGGYV